MRNIILRNRTRNDIDGQVAKILRDLGNPEPPLCLEDVRELLRLDLAYYSSEDAGIIRETFHRLKVAGKQVFLRPTLLIDAIRKWSLKALWVPDRKRILIDRELPVIKHRWAEAHETGHAIIVWHDAMLHGDNKQTLSPFCEAMLEAEANYAAGGLLFLQERFKEELRSSEPSIARIRGLAANFGNTITSTLWRAVESLLVPAVGLVTVHPHGQAKDGEQSVRYFVRSPKFAREFSGISDADLFGRLASFCRHGAGPLGESDILLRDDNGLGHVFRFETFFNSYEALTLGVYVRTQPSFTVQIPSRSISLPAAG